MKLSKIPTRAKRALLLLPALALAPLCAANPPQVVRQPTGGTFAKQATVRFYVSAASTDGGYLTYRWYRSQKFSAPLSSPLSEAEKATVVSSKSAVADGAGATLTATTPDASGYYYYWAEITNTKNGKTEAIESAIVQAKVVDRTMFTSVQHGDFEGYVRGYNDNILWANNDSLNIAGYSPVDGWWDTTHEGTPSLYTTWKFPTTGKNHQFFQNIEGNSTMFIELSNYVPASIYQEIATVPGKIYEWSLQYHAINGDSANPDVLAVIIGTAINEESDYDDMDVVNYWNKVSTSQFKDKNITIYSSSRYLPPFTYSYGSSPTEVCHTTADIQYGGPYRYGVNMNTHFNAIASKILIEKGIGGSYNTDSGANFNNVDRAYVTTYGGKPYYVFISAAKRNTPADTWYTRTGTYTIPDGQGTTVFSFVSVSSPAGDVNGNFLDNITFASGSPVSSAQEVSFTSEAQLSAATKPGYAYGLAEMRSSTATPVSGVAASYSSGAITANASGWYISESFADGGAITFKNLTPGKAYRVVGIPAAAISPALGANERPEYVLDEGYYRDTRMLPASAGDTSTVWNIDLEAVNGKARITIINALPGLEYALLDSAGGSVKVAHPWTGWTPGAGGKASFDSLALDATYYLVARPVGYAEVGYAEAAEASLMVRTPVGAEEDLSAAEVSRPSATSITVSTSSGRRYAVVDPATGRIVAQGVGDGGLLSFGSLGADLAYQVITQAGSGAWLKGVRVYPYPADLAIVSYSSETVAGAGGGVPANVQYSADLVSWTSGLGIPASLTALLDTIPAAAALRYRITAGWDGYTGTAVSPQKALAIPCRAAAPQRGSGYVVSYADEKVTIGGDTLQLRPLAQPGWTDVAADSAWTFAEFGWDGSTALIFYARFPAAAGAFASSPRPDTIPIRPAAPPVGISSAGGYITIAAMDAGKAYQYRKATAADPNPGWTDTTGVTKIDSLRFEAGDEYHIRLAATATAPASLEVTISSPLSVQPITFAGYPYGAAPAARAVVAANLVAEEVAVDSVALAGGNASPFTLSGATGSVTIPAQATSDTSWSITPRDALNAGSYSDTLKIWYKYSSQPYSVAIAVAVRLEVYRAAWDIAALSATFDADRTRADTLVVSISGVPQGAALEYYLNGGKVDEASVIVSGGRVAFGGLNPTSSYIVSAVAAGDGNHEATGRKTLVTGYTAYPTPVFSDVIEVSYLSEQLSFRPPYNGTLYTVRYGDAIIPSPYSLSGLLDTLSAGALALSLSCNAGVSPNPPYPASAAATSDSIAGRAAAPTGVTTKPADGQASDGKMLLSGVFEYRVHGSSYWLKATDSVQLSAGRYDVRLPATEATFATKDTAVRVAGLYYVSFNSSGGTPTPGQQLLPDGSRVAQPSNNPQKTGYTFGGWYTDNGTFASKWDFTACMVAQDTTLYAAWQANTYTLHFDAQGGAVSRDSQPVAYNSRLDSLPRPNRAGYTFAGWYAEPDSGGKKYTEDTVYATAAADTLYAYWTANTYQLYFDAQGGAVSRDSQPVTYDSKLDSLPEPVRTGYEFGGWFTDTAAGGKQYTVDTVYATANSDTLYAQWTDNEPSIASLTFRSSDGDVLKRWEREDITDTIFYELPCHRSSGDVLVSCELPPGVRGSYTVTAAPLAGGAKKIMGGEGWTDSTTLWVPVDSLARTVISVALENTAYAIVLSKKLGLFDVIIEHLSGILRVVNNNPAINRTGVQYSACAWWRRRDTDTAFQLVEESRLYCTAGPSLSDRFTERDSMFVVLTLLNGATLETCPDVGISAASNGSGGSAGNKSMKVAVYPNPVSAGGFIKLKQSDFADGEEEEEEERYVKYSLFSSQGSLILCGDASPLYEGQGLAMPLVPAGIYHLLLEGKSGKRWVAKVAVES
jgi:uncharacterized repeat protein (TIGR02543 family)